MDCSVSGGFSWWIGKTLAEVAIVGGGFLVFVILLAVITISANSKKARK